MAAATKVELEKNRFFRILLRFLRLQVNHNLTTVNMRDSRPRRRPRRRFYDRRALILRAGNGAGIYGGSVALSSTKSRSEEHTSELQSRFDLVCRLLLEKKNKNRIIVS